VRLFGTRRRPRVAHLARRKEAGAIVLAWDVRGGRALRWRVLRSAGAFATGPFDDTVAGSGQHLVTDQPRPGSRDDGPDLPGTTFYTVFCEEQGGVWRRAAKLKLKTGARSLERRPENDFEAGAPGALSLRDAGSVKAWGAVSAARGAVISGRRPTPEDPGPH
jgi:hypothetical protein